MPDRIYINHNHGQRRIHIEIDEAAVADLLDDFNPDDDAFDATKKLRQILVDANDDFDRDRRNDAYEAEVSR